MSPSSSKLARRLPPDIGIRQRIAGGTERFPSTRIRLAREVLRVAHGDARAAIGAVLDAAVAITITITGGLAPADQQAAARATLDRLAHRVPGTFVERPFLRAWRRAVPAAGADVALVGRAVPIDLAVVADALGMPGAVGIISASHPHRGDEDGSDGAEEVRTH